MRRIMSVLRAAVVSSALTATMAAPLAHGAPYYGNYGHGYYGRGYYGHPWHNYYYSRWHNGYWNGGYWNSGWIGLPFLPFFGTSYAGYGYYRPYAGYYYRYGTDYPVYACDSGSVYYNPDYCP